MSESNVSRRLFMGAVPAAAASAQVAAPPPASLDAKRPAGPLKIVSTVRFEPGEIKRIVGAGGDTKVEFVMTANPAEFREKIRDAEVVYGGMRGADLDFAPKLRWVQAGGAGVEGMDDVFRQSPVVMTNMARIFAPAITETAMGMLLCLTRGITTYYMPQFNKRQMKPIGTVKSPDHIELAGLTMGIVGMGGIGSTLARRAHYGFDMKVIATDAKPIPKPEYVAELYDPTWFPNMPSRVDVLVSAAPSTPLTRKMFNEDVFRSMKKTAYFMNISRGELMDDMALVKALKEGWIAGACLDVMPVEPPPSEHPIFDCKNVVMTAHTSGWSPDRQKRLVDLFADNVRRYVAGLPLRNVVDKPKGY